MSLQAVISSSPCLDFEGRPEIEPLRSWFDDLQGPDRWRSWWIVPTSRRRRQIIRAGGTASLQPRVLTIDGLLQYLQGFALAPSRPLGNTGTLLRVARAWCVARQNDAQSGNLLTPGRILQLHRIASEWRDSGQAPPPSHPHFQFLQAFDTLIEKDRCLDRSAILEMLAREIDVDGSPLARMLNGKRIWFDGFHRFSMREIMLINAIGKHADVRLWLVGVPGQPYHENVDRVLKALEIDQTTLDRRSATGLAAIGRSVFDGESAIADCIDVCAAPNIDAECHAVAVRIKSLLREWNGNGRLADIAVVVPDEQYLPVLAATFRAARIDYSPGAELFALPESRPARVLLLALRLIRNDWAAETLFDFLRQPLLFRKLSRNHLLDWFRERSSRSVARHSWTTWKKNWTELIANFEKTAAIEDQDDDESPVQRKERSQQLATDLRELLMSIDKVLVPVGRFEVELSRETIREPRKLAGAIAQFLKVVDLAGWLSPPLPPAQWDLVPAREWEIDQLAFNNLKDVLTELADLPESSLPDDIDTETILRIALSGERFQTSAEDDAGVQILRPRTIRGSKFKVIFAVGMVEGKVPRDVVEPPSLHDAKSPIALLYREQRCEQEYLFSQLFESAQERVILSRPKADGDTPRMASPFLRQVESKLGITNPLPVPSTIIDTFQALLHADRPEVKDMPEMARWLAVRNAWMHRPDPQQLQIEAWAETLLELRYPKDRAFSATALEKYASCPFQHFAARTLGLDELERDDAAMRWGSFLHEVLDAFFKERSNAGTRSVQERLLEIIARRRPAVEHTLDATYFHDVVNVLADAFATVNEYLASEGFEQVESEWEQKTVAIPDSNGGSLLLHVKIDRIDYRTSDGAEIICDFKTGSVTGGAQLRERIRSGRALQLPLYGYARELVEKKPVRHGLYVKLSRKVKADSTPDKPGPFLVNVGQLLTKQGNTVTIPFEPVEAGRLAVILASAMRSGLIPLSSYPADHKDPACVAHCSARHACRHPKGFKSS